MADRCELVEGDFFASVPAGGDVYLLKSVLHDWPDERCVTILRNCARAMSADARLLIVEAVLADRMTSSAKDLPGTLLDLIMLVYAGDRERTATEFGRLLDEAGLRLVDGAELTSGLQVLQAAVA